MEWGTMPDCVDWPSSAGPVVIEASFFLAACGALTLKKVFEGSNRPWFDFGLDLSKQVIGVLWCSAMRSLCTQVMEEANQEKVDKTCEWYWITGVFDTFLGVFVAYVHLYGIMLLLEHMLGAKAQEFKSGHYSEHPTGDFEIRRYVKQLLLWLLIVTIVVEYTELLGFVCEGPLQAMGNAALAPLAYRPQIKTTVVMICTPALTSLFQLWATDEFLKRNDKPDDTVDRRPVATNSPGQSPLNTVSTGLLCSTATGPSESGPNCSGVTFLSQNWNSQVSLPSLPPNDTAGSGAHRVASPISRPAAKLPRSDSYGRAGPREGSPPRSPTLMWPWCCCGGPAPQSPSRLETVSSW